MNARFLSALAIVALALAAPAGAADWPTVGQNLQRTAFTADCPEPPYAPQWVRADLHTENIVCWAEPIVADGRVYIGTGEGNIYALDRADGRTLWRTNLGSAVMHSVAYHEGKIFTGVQGDLTGAAVVALDAATGQVAWRSETPAGGFWSSPAVYDGLVLMGDRRGVFYAFDAETGRIRWQFQAGGPILTTAAVSEQGRVFFGAEDMVAYCLDAADGELLWQSIQLDGRTFRGYHPVLFDDKLIIRSATTLVYAAYEVEGQLLFNSWAGFPQNFQGLTRGTRPDSWNPILEDTFGNIAANGKWSYYTPQRVNEECQAYREKLRGRPALRTGFVLDQADGISRNQLPVCYASGCANTPVPAAIDADGSPIVLFKSFYSQWDVPIRAHDAIGRYVPEQDAIELLRFTGPEDPQRNGLHTYFHITADETNHLSVAGHILWNQHGTNGSRGWYVGAMDLNTGEFVYGVGGEHNAYPNAFGIAYAPAAGSSGQVGATVVSDEQVFNLVSGILTCIGPAGDAPDEIANHADPREPIAPIELIDEPAIDAEAVVAEALRPGEYVPGGHVPSTLAALVGELIEGGPWAPWRITGGMDVTNFWGGGNQYFFATPAETFGALAAAYPYLSPAMQRQVQDYLDAEWERFDPVNGQIYDPGPQEGKRYGAAELEELNRRKSYKLGYWLYGPFTRFAGVPGNVYSGAYSPVMGYYDLWLYADRMGQWDRLRDAWPRMTEHMAAFVESGAAGEANRLPLLNWYIRGAIGYVRIARHLGDDAAAERAMQPLQAMLDRRLAAEREGFNQRGIFLGIYDNSPPELMRYLATNAPDAMARTLQSDLRGTEQAPRPIGLFRAWGVGPHESRNGETCVIFPSVNYSAFQAEAIACGQSPEHLAMQCLDLPWCPADLYYIRKAALIMDLAAGAGDFQPLE